MKVKGIPDNSSIVMPRLFCRDVAAEIDFCKNTFGAVERVRRSGPDGAVAHALMTIGGDDHDRGGVAGAGEPCSQSGRQLAGGDLRLC